MDGAQGFSPNKHELVEHDPALLKLERLVDGTKRPELYLPLEKCLHIFNAVDVFVKPGSLLVVVHQGFHRHP